MFPRPNTNDAEGYLTARVGNKRRKLSNSCFYFMPAGRLCFFTHSERLAVSRLIGYDDYAVVFADGYNHS